MAERKMEEGTIPCPDIPGGPWDPKFRVGDTVLLRLKVCSTWPTYRRPLMSVQRVDTMKRSYTVFWFGENGVPYFALLREETLEAV